MKDEEVVAELRNIADRIESGEQAVTEIELRTPRGNTAGRVSFEIMSEDELHRISKIFG